MPEQSSSRKYVTRTKAEHLVLAERAFLDASVAVWREIDRLSAQPEGYRGLEGSTELRVRERGAWERYRVELDRDSDKGLIDPEDSRS